MNIKNSRTTLGSTVSRFGECWTTLALTDIVWKIVAFVALTPLVALLFRARLAMSGRTVAADQDILLIFLQPAGLVSAILLGAVLLAIVALEQAALMAILYAHLAGRRAGPVVALRFALAHAWPVLRLAARMVGATLLAAAPFLAALALVYVGLLADHDINFYLKERPPAFLAAAGIGVVVAAALSATLLRLFTGWFYALPLLLFEDVPPPRALRASRDRARGHRAALLAWIAGWALALAAVSAAVSSGTIGLARLVVPRAIGSVPLLTFAIGVTLLVWVLVNLAINLLGITTAAVIVFTLYRDRGNAAQAEAARVTRFERDLPRAAFALTPRRLTRWAAGSLLAAFAVGAIAVHTTRLDDNVQVAAHRGSSKAAPENSLSAVRQAIADGADWVEIDVQETADGEVIVSHDSDFMKMAGVGTKVWDATLADLQAIDIGSRFSTAFKGERVPTLAAVLDACKGRIRVLIELKYLRARQAARGEGRPARGRPRDGWTDSRHVARTRCGPEDEGAAAGLEGRTPDVRLGRQPANERRRFPGGQRPLRHTPLRPIRPPPGHEGLRLDGRRRLDDVGDDGPRGGRRDHQQAGAREGRAGRAGRDEPGPPPAAGTGRRAGREA